MTSNSFPALLQAFFTERLLRQRQHHGPFFPKPLGELSVGAYADIILLDYEPTTPMKVGNLPWHLIFGMDGGQVSTTIVGGKVLMKDRELLTLDEEAICARSRELAQKLWARM